MRIAIATVVFGCLATAAAAQTVTGTLQGTVTDASGGVLPGATVKIVNVELGTTRDVLTNEAGLYSAPFLPIGVYRVSAALSGFGTVLREDVRVTLNQTQVANFQLKPAAVAETVTVVGAAPPINTTNAEIKSTLNEQEIQDKPTLNPGSFLSLAEIFPGFQDNPTSGQNNPTASSGSSINFNGTGTRGATFQINGVNNDDSSENQHRQGAALSTIKEFQVLSNTYSAEFGRGFGAVVLVQTKSGTNRWHGDTYEFVQDSNDLAKVRKFASAKPDNQRHQYGGTVGFPIQKNRIFAFGSLDRTQFKGTVNYARDLFLPSELAKPWLTRGNDTPENRAWIESILARYPKVTPNDPRSSRTYATLRHINQPDEDYSGRVDWQFGADSLIARYQTTHQIREADDIIVGEATRQNNKQKNLGVTWTKIIRNNLLGEFRYGLGMRTTRVDIAAGNTTPIVRFTGSPVSGTTLGDSGVYPINRYQRDHQVVYNLSWLFRRGHNLKSGVDIRRQQLDDTADSFSRGFWTFTVSCGGVTYATPYEAMLDGCVNRFEKSWGPFFLENRFLEANFYAEDNWRVRPHLTLNLGVRYEFVSAPKDLRNRIDYRFEDDTDNYEPRLGAAWTLPGSKGWLRSLTGSARGDASLRGGYGLYHGRIFQSVFTQNGASIRTNPPEALSRVITTQPNILNVSDPTLAFVFTPGLPSGRYSIVVPNENLEMPYTHQWSLSFERKIPLNSTLRISYNGNHAVGTLRYTNDNLPRSPLDGPITVPDHPNNAPGTGLPDLRGKIIDRIAADVLCAGTGFLPGANVNATCPNPVPLGDNEISSRFPRTNERRPNPVYGTNTLVSNGAESWYKGIQFEWIKRLAKGLSFSTSYTRSKSEDTTSEATFVGAGDTNFLGPKKQYSKGYSRFHTPHRFTFNGTYLLPFFQKRTDLLGELAGGWQLSGTLKLASGTPFSVTQTGIDLNFDGFAEGRPVILDRSILGRSIDDPATSRDLLPLSAFRATTLGDTLDQIVPRNSFFGDGLEILDMALIKNFLLQGGRALSVRIEGYNVFNVVQYGFPAAAVTTPGTFGSLTGLHSLYGPRTLQIAFRFRY